MIFAVYSKQEWYILICWQNKMGVEILNIDNFNMSIWY